MSDISPIRLPDYVSEEFNSLCDDEVSPATAWTRTDQATTSFRRDILPHKDADDARFRVVVPVSGGLDSTTCHEMASSAGLPVEAVTVNTHTDYVKHDQIAARQLCGDLTTLDLAASAKSTEDFQLGRDSLIVWRVLEWMTANGWWGEIWFGNLGGNYLETPIVGGDKSFRWLLAMQQLSTVFGHDVRLASPLIGLSKADLVSWWIARGRVDKALSTRSCFANQPAQCGRCWACLARYVAFAARGHERQVAATYPDGIDFTQPIATLRSRLNWNTVTTHPARCQELKAVLAKIG